MKRIFRIVLKGKQWRQGEQVRKSPGAEVCLVHPEKKARKLVWLRETDRGGGQRRGRR